MPFIHESTRCRTSFQENIGRTLRRRLTERDPILVLLLLAIGLGLGLLLAVGLLLFLQFVRQPGRLTARSSFRSISSALSATRIKPYRSAILGSILLVRQHCTRVQAALRDSGANRSHFLGLRAVLIMRAPAARSAWVNPALGATSKSASMAPSTPGAMASAHGSCSVNRMTLIACSISRLMLTLSAMPSAFLTSACRAASA